MTPDAFRRAEWWSLSAALIWIETGDWGFASVAEATSGAHRTPKGRRIPPGLIGAMRIGLLAHAKYPERLVQGVKAPRSELIGGSGSHGARRLREALVGGAAIRLAGRRQDGPEELIANLNWRDLSIVANDESRGPHIWSEQDASLYWVDVRVSSTDLRKHFPARRGPKHSSGSKNAHDLISAHIVYLIECGPPPPDREQLRADLVDEYRRLLEARNALRRESGLEPFKVDDGTETVRRLWGRAIREALRKGLPYAELWNRRGRPPGRKDVH